MPARAGGDDPHAVRNAACETPRMLETSRPPTSGFCNNCSHDWSLGGVDRTIRARFQSLDDLIDARDCAATKSWSWQISAR